MIRAFKANVSAVDRINNAIGRVVMFGSFVTMGILLWSSISKTFFLPPLWVLELAQFAMVATWLLQVLMLRLLAAPRALAALALAQSPIRRRMQIELFFANHLRPTGELFQARRRGRIDAVRTFWNEIASEPETKARVVDTFNQYNADMARAGCPYRYG